MSPSYRIVARTKGKDDVSRRGPCGSRAKKVQVISSESEDVRMNCPHVRSEIFAPRADERGIRRADERALQIPQAHKAGMLATYSGLWSRLKT